MIRNVLASRYASPEMIAVWDEAGKIQAERRLWITVLEVQRSLGVDIPPEAISAYGAHVEEVDLESIARREQRLRHDVKARIEEFNALAGHEVIHLGMTSRDLTENVEQLQVRDSLELVLVRAVAALDRLARLAADHSDVVVTARTHNVPAQATTFGKRIAAAGEELQGAIETLESLLARYSLRGIKGPVGTQQDQIDLIGRQGAAELDRRVAAALGFEQVMGSIGQVYPRSLDFEVVSTLVRLATAPSSFTTTLRLMAGHDLAGEGFQEGQVGSSAMPHKMNPRTSERIHGLKVVLSGHLAMAAGLAGEQWNEGDVSDSVVRRVMLPDAFFAIDGLFQAFLAVVSELGVHRAVIAEEVRLNLPFLATTKLLIGAVRAGSGRERAHEIIKRHSVAAARARLEAGAGPDLLARLAADPQFPLDVAAISAVVDDPMSFTGAASDQVESFVAGVVPVLARHPEAGDYQPARIL